MKRTALLVWLVVSTLLIGFCSEVDALVLCARKRANGRI